MKKYTVRVGTDNGWYDITPTFPREAALHIADATFNHTNTPWVEVWSDEGLVEVWEVEPGHHLNTDASEQRRRTRPRLYWQSEIEGTPI